MKRFVGLLVLIVLQLGTAVGWLAYGTGRQVSGEVGSWEQIQELSPEEKQMQNRLALWYDLNLNNAGEGAPLEGYEQIMFFEDGLMCCVEFSQAQKILPVWHGAREKPTGGLTHFSRSSLPVGGKGNHTVLTCREKDLGDMTLPECGDEFIVHVLGDAITYRVQDVLRTRGELAAPERDANKDLCSIWVRRGAGWVIIQAEREDAKVEKGENIG